MQLPDRRVEVSRERGDPRVAERACRDHYVVGLPAPRPRRHEVAPVALLDRIHLDAGFDRQLEARRSTLRHHFAQVGPDSDAEYLPTRHQIKKLTCSGQNEEQTVEELRLLHNSSNEHCITNQVTLITYRLRNNGNARPKCI